MIISDTLVVGTDKRLTDILGSAEVTPLLEGAVKAGAGYAALAGPEGEVLWEAGTQGASAENTSMPIMLEGEAVGMLMLRGGGADGEHIKGIETLLLEAVHRLVQVSLKRLLTTELHAKVVNQSYEQLLETNRLLTASEGKYRELAATLEQKVAQRTAELEQAHTRLLQQQKMASIGQLAAGLAHEINNPLGFITSNLNTLQKYTGRMVMMLDYYSSLLESDPTQARYFQLSSHKWQELKLDSICADIGPLLCQSLEGAERVKKIVADLKGFSHIDDTEVGIVDLNVEIDRTLSVLEHRYPPGTGIVKNYRELPGFSCNPAHICQLFLHIIENALEARPEGPRIVISTTAINGMISISFADNGPGIPKEIRSRIFDPFYSTKEVGNGTGMGLTVAYDIVSSLEGTIEVTCPAGGGTIITITLPLQRKHHGPLL